MPDLTPERIRQIVAAWDACDTSDPPITIREDWPRARTVEEGLHARIRIESMAQAGDLARTVERLTADLRDISAGKVGIEEYLVARCFNDRERERSGRLERELATWRQRALAAETALDALPDPID